MGSETPLPPVAPGSENPAVKVLGLLRLAVWGASLGSILLYFTLVGLRIGYPFELETFEGVMADHVLRILDGLPLYTAPSMDFAQCVYAPLYYYVSALFAKTLGLHLWVLRLVSVLASIACLALLFAYVRRETGSRLCACLASGFYAATYGVCVGWFDTARVDSLYLCLLLSGVYALRFTTSRVGWIATGILLALAFFTKQTTLPASLPVLGVVALFHPLRAIWILVPFFSLIWGGSLLMDFWYDGWFWPYFWGSLSEHPLREGRALEFWTRHVARQMPLIAAMALAGIGVWMRNWTNWREKFFLLALAGGFLAAAWIGRWSVGGAQNALLPSCAIGALLLGILLHHALERTSGLMGKQIVLYALVLLQFALVAYDPRSLVPSRADREAGKALIERLKNIEGDVWVAFHGHLGPMAGKPAHALYYFPLPSFTPRGGGGPVFVKENLDRAVREQRFAAILFDAHSLPEGWDAYYREAGPVFDRPDVFFPVTGYQTRPRGLFVRRPRNEVSLPSLSEAQTGKEQPVPQEGVKATGDE